MAMYVVGEMEEDGVRTILVLEYFQEDVEPQVSNRFEITEWHTEDGVLWLPYYEEEDDSPQRRTMLVVPEEMVIPLSDALLEVLKNGPRERTSVPATGLRLSSIPGWL